MVQRAKSNAFMKKAPDWSAVQISSYGYALLTTSNDTLEFAMYDVDHKVLDEMVITKTT